MEKYFLIWINYGTGIFFVGHEDSVWIISAETENIAVPHTKFFSEFVLSQNIELPSDGCDRKTMVTGLCKLGKQNNDNKQTNKNSSRDVTLKKM